MSRALGTAVAVLGACLSVSMAGAASIGINFYGNATTDQLAAGDVAGYGPVAQANWNNMTAYSGGSWAGGSLGLSSTQNSPNIINNGSVIVDSVGAEVVTEATNASTGMCVHVGTYDQPYGSNSNWTNHGNFWVLSNSGTWGFSGNDGILQQGEFRPTVPIQIVNIPYAQYDIYAYVGHNGNTGGGCSSPTLSVLGGAPGTVDGNTYLAGSVWKASNSYTLATTTSAGNVVRFVDNTASSVQLNWNPTPGGWEGLVAIQIVAVPEPTSLGLLGLGSLALLVRRRAAH